MLRLFAMAVLTSCTAGDSGAGGFFADVTARSGIDFRLVNGTSGEHFIVETMIGGLGWIDYDGDGDFDLYLANAHSRPREADRLGEETDRLYRNDGGGRFTDATKAAGVGERGYGGGVAVGDYDNDGDADLFVTNFGRNTLYRNGGGTFADVAAQAGLAEPGYSTSAAWFDMDRDGDLDLYVVRYLRYQPATSRSCREKGLSIYCSPKLFPGERDLLYRNLGGGVFEEIGERAGIERAGEEGKGLGVAVADFDADGFLDVYVANDTTPNFLWKNRGDGTFVDIAPAAGAALSADGRPQAGMGVDLADVDADGRTDIHVTNFAKELNSLFRAKGNGVFEESARRANLAATYESLGFGTLFLDVDLDGDPDIVNANGHVDDVVERSFPETGSSYRQRTALLLNGGDGRFEEASDRGGPFFRERVVGRGLARADFDNDGDVDLALMALDRSLVLLRNENPFGHRSLTIRLEGTRSPRDAAGASIEVEVDGRRRVFEYSTARSYLSAGDPRVVVGLGKASRVGRLRIRWSSGLVQEVRDVPAEGFLDVREP